MLLAQVFIGELVGLLFVGLVLLMVLVIILHTFGLWLQAFMAGVHLSLPQIVAMKFRKVDPRVVVRTLIMMKQAGIEVSCEEVEQAYLQGADLYKITAALIQAEREGWEMSFQELVEADLDGSLGEDLRE